MSIFFPFVIKKVFQVQAFALCALLLLLTALAMPVQAANEELELSVSFARDKAKLIAAVQIRIPENYYIYPHASTEGQPTSLLLPPEQAHSVVYYPKGARGKYTNEVTLFVDLSGKIASQEQAQVLHGMVRGLLCSNSRCVPQKIVFESVVPKELSPVSTMPWGAAWAAAQKLSSANPDLLPVATAQAGGLAAVPLMPLGGGQSAAGAVAAMPLPPAGQGGAEAIAPLPVPKAEAALGATIASPWALEPSYADDAVEVNHWGKALLLGFLAGLLLNVMPCVLPVLTLKVSGMLVAAGQDTATRQARFREHNIFFAAGVMTWFVLLAVVLGLAGLMWGQLFQNQIVILSMLCLVFLLGLSMLGVFTLPMIDLKGSATGSPRMQAYSTGLLATLLATPCSGPLLGGVLSWAFTQPVTSMVVIFCAVGLGMASPYLLFAYKPHLVHLMPRPGAWMNVLEKGMGFFLLATALYLLSILPQDMHMQVLTALLIIAACGWVWGRYCSYNAPPRRRLLARLAGGLLLVGGLLYATQPVRPALEWEQFNPTQLNAVAGKQPLFVEFTADWCPNCKFLEATVLKDDKMKDLQQRYGFRLIRVDLTREDPIAQSLLEALGSKSIPLTALFPTGEGWKKPLVLRDVYSMNALEQALQKVFDEPHQDVGFVRGD